MVMSRIWTGLVLVAVVFSIFTNRGSELSASVLQGAQSGITLAISLAGSLCLWCGIARVMEHSGITRVLTRLFAPVLGRLFPSTGKDPVLAGNLSGNFCANLLGLGNAATPLGIAAVRDLSKRSDSGDELCRFIVLNTASIQLIPANVAAVRSSLGSAAPFDILGAVWITSFCSAGLGLTAAWLLGKVWPHD